MMSQFIMSAALTWQLFRTVHQFYYIMPYERDISTLFHFISFHTSHTRVNTDTLSFFYKNLMKILGYKVLKFS